jgi:hypothetical protein
MVHAQVHFSDSALAACCFYQSKYMLCRSLYTAVCLRLSQVTWPVWEQIRCTCLQHKLSRKFAYTFHPHVITAAFYHKITTGAAMAAAAATAASSEVVSIAAVAAMAALLLTPLVDNALLKPAGVLASKLKLRRMMRKQ